MARLPDRVANEHINPQRRSSTPARLLRGDVEDVPPTWQLEEQVQSGLEHLMALVSRDWLRAEAQKTHRLDSQFQTEPLHLVSGTLAGQRLDIQRPHYFAHMLLVARDFLDGHAELDYWVAPTLWYPETRE